MVACQAAGLVVKEHRPLKEWFGRVRGEDGKQRWIRASDLRPAKAE